MNEKPSSLMRKIGHTVILFMNDISIDLWKVQQKNFPVSLKELLRKNAFTLESHPNKVMQHDLCVCLLIMHSAD